MARRGLKPGQTTSTSFKPGNSANPGGRPKAAIGWRQSIRDNDTLREISEGIADGRIKPKPGQAEHLRWQLSQGFGSPVQTTETIHQARGRLDELTAEQLQEVRDRIDGVLRERRQLETQPSVEDGVPERPTRQLGPGDGRGTEDPPADS